MTKYSAPPPTAPQNQDSLIGFGFAVSAFTFWGILPLYLKALSHIAPGEVIAHRAFWSLPVVLIILIALKAGRGVWPIMRDPKKMGMIALMAVLISANWSIYLWAIIVDRAIETALGYYINPLFNIVVGALFLGERLHKLQIVAVALAAAAVGLLTYDLGSLPILALGITTSFGIYAYLKKMVPIDPNQGFFLEVLLMAPFALGYIIWTLWTGESTWLYGSVGESVLLMGAGVVSAVPLLLYANGAKHMRLSTMGILQYISPTLIFLVAVFVFNEPFGWVQAVAFAMIWAGLGLYTLAMLRQKRS